MRSPFPLKKGEGMRKGRMFFIDTQTRKISPLGQSRLLLPLGRNDKEGIILRDPFDCAAQKSGLPKIAAKRDFWEEERQALQARRQA